jgi:1,4-dihydroxy-2-naphthoate octaprenyltransferase
MTQQMKSVATAAYFVFTLLLVSLGIALLSNTQSDSYWNFVGGLCTAFGALLAIGYTAIPFWIASMPEKEVAKSI